MEHTPLDYFLEILKKTATTEQQKSLVSSFICRNNMDVIAQLRKLYQYCISIGNIQLAEKISKEITDRQTEIDKEIVETIIQ